MKFGFFKEENNHLINDFIEIDLGTLEGVKKTLTPDINIYFNEKDDKINIPGNLV